MTEERAFAFRVFGVAMIFFSAIALVISPPANTLYQHHGFFWWGFVPGLVFTLGLGAIMASFGSTE